MAVQVTLQPTSDKSSRRHYADTIDQPVPLHRIRAFDDSVATKLESRGAESTIPVWGVTPGKRGVNIKRWERLNEGGLVLFTRDGGIVSSARKLTMPHLPLTSGAETKMARPGSTSIFSKT